MQPKKFSNLLKNKKASAILEEYMLGKHGDLTERQLDTLILKKEPNEQGHGGVAFSYRKRG